MLTQEKLKTKLEYDPLTGLFTWVERFSSRAGKGELAGSVTSHGYISIRIFGKAYLAHRLAWLYVNGEFPQFQIDHRDTNKSNNSWTNFRPATNAQNVMNTGIRANNKSGHKGVSWYARYQKWRVGCKADGVRHHLGYFENIDDAVKAYAACAKRIHGEFCHASI